MAREICKCRFCKRGRHIDRIVKGRSVKAMRELIRTLEDMLINAEFEASCGAPIPAEGHIHEEGRK